MSLIKDNSDSENEKRVRFENEKEQKNIKSEKFISNVNFNINKDILSIDTTSSEIVELKPWQFRKLIETLALEKFSYEDKKKYYEIMELMFYIQKNEYEIIEANFKDDKKDSFTKNFGTIYLNFKFSEERMKYKSYEISKKRNYNDDGYDYKNNKKSRY